MPKVKPPFAALAAVVAHSILSGLMLAIPTTSSGEWVLLVLAIAALLLPGLVAGLLTTTRPLVVGLCSAVAILLVQSILTYVLLGAYSWSLFLLGLPGTALQLVVLCIVAVAAFHFRARLRPSREAIAG